MARAKRGTKARSRRKKVLKRAEGFYGGRRTLFRTAKEAVDRSLVYAYTGRKQKKRDFRQLWQIRIGAAVKEMGLSYSRFMHGLKTKGIALNRKMLAELAATQPADFAKLVAHACPEPVERVQK
ncbi:MAG: 50S ribosomal protein L20 [Deltaproteobacteria bacterium]|nr:50S ribosomal protein L20 [Deltaproteobacteria bacterium]MDZ4224324.1 50S ribosomal protein L20 [bacterium]